MRAAAKPQPVPAKRALRPRDIAEQFGIPPSTLHFYCERLPAERRLPSLKLPGRGGRKGKRLVFEDELLAWLEKHRASTTAA